MMAMMVEVLPAPLGPSSASTDPAGTSMLKSSTARTAPYPQLRCSSRSMRLPGAEIGRAHGRVGHDLARRAIVDDAALVEDEKTAARAHDLRQVVLDQYDRDAGGIDGSNDVGELAGLAVIESGQGLVQENENGINGKCTRNFKALEMTEGQRRDRLPLLIRQTDLCKHRVRPRLFRRAPISQQGTQRVGGEPVTGGKGDVLQRGHGAERAHDLVRDRKPAAHARLGRQ